METAGFQVKLALVLPSRVVSSEAIECSFDSLDRSLFAQDGERVKHSKADDLAGHRQSKGMDDLTGLDSFCFAKRFEIVVQGLGR
jgi:hypothetical protein